MDTMVGRNKGQTPRACISPEPFRSVDSSTSTIITVEAHPGPADRLDHAVADDLFTEVV